MIIAACISNEDNSYVLDYSIGLGGDVNFQNNTILINALKPWVEMSGTLRYTCHLGEDIIIL